jgi:glycosyltransferase involved in cell wall biosynthesis
MKLVSIIITCFNSEAFVNETVQSALNQSYNPCEIILIDNNSTDNTLSILIEFAEKHTDKIKVFQEFKKGAPAARNKGLQVAKGEWIQFLDSDDIILPNKIKNQMELTEGSDLIIGYRFKCKSIDGKQKYSLDKSENNKPLIGLIKSKLGSTSSILWKKDSVVQVGGWNEQQTSSQEYELMFRMYKNNLVFKQSDIPETIVLVRSDSISKSTQLERITQIIKNNINLRLEIKAYLKYKGLLTDTLEKEIDCYIYSKLLNDRKKAPEYINKFLKEEKLKVPLTYKLKRQVSILNSKIKRYLHIK